MDSLNEIRSELKGGKKLSASELSLRTGQSKTTVYTNLKKLGAVNADGKYSLSGGTAAAAKKVPAKKTKAASKAKATNKKVATEEKAAFNESAQKAAAPKTNPK